jgi:RHS repeat-associated protein
MTYNRNSAITTLARTGNSQAGYGNMDFLSYSYVGNWLKSIYDMSSSNVYDGAFEFVDGANNTQEYWYNAAGDLTSDANKGIALINYDLLGHPTRVQFTNGNVTEYVYAADGRKLRAKQTTAVEGLTVAMGHTLELTAAQIMDVDFTDYAGNLQITRGLIGSNPNVPSVDYHFGDGYLSITAKPYRPYPGAVVGVRYVDSYHYYLRDHLGSNRMVVSGDGAIEQANEYYPYGGPWGDVCTNQGLQPYKYNCKELDRVHGLDWYDYGARMYDPAFCQFTQMDPLCEQYPHLSPYAYCAGNPVRYVDPDGRKINLSLLDEEQQKRFKDQINFVSNYSPLFYKMYQSLYNSDDVYYINYGSINKEGQFQKNDKGGGTITFSSKIKDTKVPVLSEELFHAYQHDNRNRYDQGEFNREFEAKVFVHAVASDVGGISSFDNTNFFLSDIYNRKYGNDNQVITPMNVESPHFLKAYYKFANIFADYNRKNNIGNINYRRYTTIPPYSLQTIVRNAY